MPGLNGERDNFSGDMVITAPAAFIKGRAYQLNSGTIVVARETIASSATGIVAVDGAIYVEKDTAASSAIALGGKIYLIAATGRITGASAGNVLTNWNLINGAALADAASQAFVLMGGSGQPPTAT